MALTGDSITALSPWFRGLSFVGLVGGTAKGFEWLESSLSDKGKKVISDWLKSAPGDERFESWMGVFANLIDEIFGTEPVSWKFFFRSCLASLVATTTVALLVAHSSEHLASIVSVVIFEAFIANLVPDYLSLLISRTFVNLMAESNSWLKIMKWLFLDTACTALIANVSLSIAETIWYPIINYRGVKPFPSEMNDVFFMHDKMMIFFWSAFFTSAWVWLYVLAGAFIKIARKVSVGWTVVSPFMDIEKKPLTAIGRIAGLAAGATYGLVSGALLLRQYASH
jgi:hypothetical protein